jgi:RimJ/RimL family protein N-acetyltransferase
MTGVRLEPWGKDRLPLLRATVGDPSMTEHLGGPETEEQLVARQARFERLAESGKGRMFAVVLDGAPEPVGSVGYWEREWRGEQVFETGWFVLPAYQGRGIAAAATALVIDLARADRTHRSLHAFPSIENAPSNAICRKLGFTLVEEIEFEYPPGHLMRCNDWRLEL